MVWFQCEVCGDEVKKPKLANHLRFCSATKLSCIDCGVMFGRESVQGHNQCITEAEKYGPKGQGKASSGATPKPTKNAKQQPDVDINVGLSERPPWFCSLCNTKATSKQALLLHADGKKHCAKARAIHASKQQETKQTEESAQDNPSNIQNTDTANGDLHDRKQAEEQNVLDMPEADRAHANPELESGKLTSKKKRKFDESGSDSAGQKKDGDTTHGVGKGVLQSERAKAEEMGSQLKKAIPNGIKDDKVVESAAAKEDSKKKMKLKKLIKSALKSNPDGVLKMKKLKKLVLKSLQESGIAEDETQLCYMLEQKVNSSSGFRVDKKYVYLVTKDSS